MTLTHTGAMKIQISVTVEVNEQDWAEEYGCEVREVRADVKRWAATRLHTEDARVLVR